MSKYRIGDQVKVIEAPEYLFHGGEVLGISGDGETVFVRFEAEVPVEMLYLPKRMKEIRELRRQDNLQCSFCGKTNDEAVKLIAGSGVYICDECIGICNQIITDAGT